MLVRITNKCEMGCNHCMINATPDGEHMSIETFKKVIDFSAEYDPMVLFLSGGEPFEHPDFFEIADIAKSSVSQEEIGMILIASNGMFLDNEELTKKILALNIPIQITNDVRYYPKRVKRIDSSLLSYEDNLRSLSSFGRAVQNNIPSTRSAPMCFNLRSVASQITDLREGLGILRSKIKMCTPSINIDGTIVAGESSECSPVGTVDSSGNEILQNVREKFCEQCGAHRYLEGLPKKLWGKMKMESKEIRK